MEYPNTTSSLLVSLTIIMKRRLIRNTIYTKVSVLETSLSYPSQLYLDSSLFNSSNGSVHTSVSIVRLLYRSGTPSRSTESPDERRRGKLK